MKITFDIFEIVPELLDDLKPEELMLFKTIVDYFEQRWQPIKDKIEKEERKNQECEVIICLLDEAATKRILIKGYSTDLLNKMEESIKPEDLEYLNKLLETKWQSFNN